MSEIEGAGTLTYDNDVTGDDGRGAGNHSAVIWNNVRAARTLAWQQDPARAF